MPDQQSQPPRRQLPLVLDIFAKGRYKNVDRRQCHRVVPMKVLGLGLSRTGTSSLRQALSDLGLNDVYHQASLNIDNPRDGEMWVEACRAKWQGVGEPFGRARFDQLLGHCMAVTDVPCVAFWRELMDAYPEARVVLTVRDDADAWYRSFMMTSMPLMDGILGRGWLSFFNRLLMPYSANSEYIKFLLKHDDAFGTCWRDQQHGTSEGRASYDRHNNAVLQHAREQGREVLVYNVKQGWAPLCKFLDLPVPDEPFPRLNDLQHFQHGITRTFRVFAVTMFVRACMFLAPVVLGAYLLGRSGTPGWLW